MSHPAPIAQVISSEPNLTAYPNPADSWITFAYDLKAAPENVLLIIEDLNGREIERTAITKVEGQWVWDIRRVVPGAYNARLTAAGKILATQRVIVQP